MTPETYQRAHEIFGAAVSIRPADRADYVAQACADDVELQRFVCELLASDSALPENMRLGLGSIPMASARDIVGSIAPPRIGDYEIQGVLGVGSSGVVVRARRPTLGRDVAIKILHLDDADGQHARRFAVEAHMLGLLDHPGIVRILDFGTVDARPYLVMELVEGCSITQYCRERDLDARHALELVAAVADAVQHAHQRGVIHRDLKPANIRVTEDGRPRILDFGIARTLGTGHGMTALDGGTNAVVGTLGYMSPEQMHEGPRAVDMRADVFALGAIAHELVLRSILPRSTLPDSSPSLRGILDAKRVPLGEVDRRLGGDMEAAISKALAVDKNARYASAADFADDLRRLLADEPITARRPGLRRRLGRALRRNRAALALGSAVLLALGAAVVSQHAEMERARREIEQYEAASQMLLTFVNDPCVNTDGTVTPASEATLLEKFRAADTFLSRLGDVTPATRGSFYALAARVVGSIGNATDDRATALRYAESAVTLLTEALGPDHYQTLRARCDLIRRLQVSNEVDRASALLDPLQQDALAAAPDDAKIHLQIARMRYFLAETPEARALSGNALRTATRNAESALGEHDELVLASRALLTALLPSDEAFREIDRLRPILEEHGRPRALVSLGRQHTKALQEHAGESGDPEDALHAYHSRRENFERARTLLGGGARSTRSLEIGVADMEETLASRGLLADGSSDPP